MSASDDHSQERIANLHRLNAVLAAYREISEGLLRASTVEEVAHAATEILVQFLGAEGAAMMVIEENDPESEPRWYYAAPGRTCAAPHETVRKGLLEAILTHNRPFPVAAVPEFLARHGLPQADHPRNFLAIPLRVAAEPIGTFIAYNLAFPEHITRYAHEVESFALPVAHAIVRARLIQERERQARLVEATLESTSSCVAYLDRELRFVRVNSAFVSAMGIGREELIGRTPAELRPDLRQITDALVRTRDTGQPTAFIEVPMALSRKPDLGTRYLDFAITPVQDQDGVVSAVVISIVDATEKVEQRERLLAAERTRADLAETVAVEVNHRVKNNLAMVAGLLEIQARHRGARSAAARELMEAAARVQSIAAVHTQLAETHLEEVDLLEALRRVAEVAGDALAAGRVELSVEGDQVSYPAKAATSLCVTANELITNALKHASPGPAGVIRVRVELRLSQGELRLSVWNSGRPVSARFDVARHAKVGLTLVNEIATRQYQGSFSVGRHDDGTLAEVVIADDRLRRDQ